MYIWHWVANALISEARFALTMAVNGKLCVPTAKISDTLWSSMAVSKVRHGLSLHLILYVVIAVLWYSSLCTSTV